jgi:hypothetical protein
VDPSYWGGGAAWAARAYFTALLLSDELLVLIGGSKVVQESSSGTQLYNEVWAGRFTGNSTGAVAGEKLAVGGNYSGNYSSNYSAHTVIDWRRAGCTTAAIGTAAADGTDASGSSCSQDGSPPWGKRVFFATAVQVQCSYSALILCTHTYSSLCRMARCC